MNTAHRLPLALALASAGLAGCAEKVQVEPPARSIPAWAADPRRIAMPDIPPPPPEDLRPRPRLAHTVTLGSGGEPVVEGHGMGRIIGPAAREAPLGTLTPTHGGPEGYYPSPYGGRYATYGYYGGYGGVPVYGYPGVYYGGGWGGRRAAPASPAPAEPSPVSVTAPPPPPVGGTGAAGDAHPRGGGASPGHGPGTSTSHAR